MGRTNLLLNVAYALAKANKFVVIADWDIHAPGLSCMPELSVPLRHPAGAAVSEKTHIIRAGVVNYLQDMLLISKRGTKRVIMPESLARPTHLGQDARRNDFGFRGDIWFIPAGPFDPAQPGGEYNDILQTIQKKAMPMWTPASLKKLGAEGLGLPHVGSYFCSRLELLKHPGYGEARDTLRDRAPDYLLLDARTGMTEIQDMILHSSRVNRIVLVTGLNDQNLAGLEITIRALQERERVRIGEFRSKVMIAVSPMPAGEEALKKQRLDRLDALLRSLARQTPVSLEEEPMPEIFTIPYHPHIALSESLMIREFPDSDPAISIQAIVNALQPGEIVGEEERKRLFLEKLVRSGMDDLPLVEKQLEPGNANKPMFPLHPWAQPPVWNWPDPAVTPLEFAPLLPAEHHNLLNGLSRSLFLSREDQEKLLDKLGDYSDYQFTVLGNIFRDELIRFNGLDQDYWQNLLELGVNQWAIWLDLWCSRRGIEKKAILRAVVSGERDFYLASWAKIGYFWFGLATLLSNEKEWELAASAYRRAIEINQNDAYPWNNLGFLLHVHLGRFQEAEAAYRRAIEIDQNFAFPWHNLGNLFLHQQRFADASVAYAKAMEVDQAEPHYPHCAAGVALLIEDWDQAAALLERAAPLCVDKTASQQNHAMLMLAFGLTKPDQELTKKAVQKLSQWYDANRPPSTWNYDDIMPAIKRAPPEAQALFMAWVDKIKQRDGADVVAAFEIYFASLTR